MKQIEQLAAAALGIDAKRGDLLAVENLSFQSLQQDAPALPTFTERVQRSLRELGVGRSAIWRWPASSAACICCCSVRSRNS